jgi:hypothetical protein
MWSIEPALDPFAGSATAREAALAPTSGAGLVAAVVEALPVWAPVEPDRALEPEGVADGLE